jgi:hypothetical protein
VGVHTISNGDGTHSYSYTINLDGKITYSIILYTQGGIYSEYFDNTNASGTVAKTNITSTLNFNWGLGSIFSGNFETVSARYLAKIKAPTTDTYTIFFFRDDGVRIYIDGTLKLNYWASGQEERSFTISLLKMIINRINDKWNLFHLATG